MVVVFGSFLLEDDRIIKLFGTGLALALLLDATLVRMLLVPATMDLLGSKDWWLPRWLDQILPRLNVTGIDTEVPADPGELLDDVRVWSLVPCGGSTPPSLGSLTSVAG